MSSIAIVTDTDSSLPVDLAAQYGIRQVPISIQFGSETFDASSMNDMELFERIDREGKLPTTAAPAPGKFSEAYGEAFAAGAEKIICLCVSSEVSATYSAAVTACAEFPDRDIAVVDTLNLTIGQGYMAIAAAQAAEEGLSVDEIVARARNVGERTHLFAALATLKYLAMSGRVGHLAAGMATLLNVKPILTIRDGKLDMLERVRARGKAWARAIELAKETAAGRSFEQMSIVHAAAPAEARMFEQLLRENLPCPDEILYVELTAGLSVHAGAGLVGVAFMLSEN